MRKIIALFCLAIACGSTPSQSSNSVVHKMVVVVSDKEAVSADKNIETVPNVHTPYEESPASTPSIESGKARKPTKPNNFDIMAYLRLIPK